MNREVGTNPNTAWPRRLAAGIVFAIGAAGCSAVGPNEIASTETPATPVECVTEARYSFEVEPQVEAIKQNIDAMLCETANELAARAIETYREDDILTTQRDEGPNGTDSGVYGFSYSRLGGADVSVQFGMTATGKPDLSDLRSIFISEDDHDDDGEVIGYSYTSITRLDDGGWTISEHLNDGDEPNSDYYFSPNDTEIQNNLTALQHAQDEVFARILINI